MNFEQVTNFDAIYEAYKKARCGHGYNQSRLKFEMAALDGVLQIKRLLETKKFEVSPYNQFRVFEPKERVIEAGSFKDKIIQHSLCDNVLLPAFKSEFIQTNVAGQIGKGTLYGLDCLRAHMLLAHHKYGHDCWIVKADIKKYFYNIDHNILKDIVQYYISDGKKEWAYMIAVQILSQIIILYAQIKPSDDSCKKHRNYLLKKFKQYYPDALKEKYSKKRNLLRRIKFKAFIISPNCFCRVLDKKF